MYDNKITRDRYLYYAFWELMKDSSNAKEWDAGRWGRRWSMDGWEPGGMYLFW